MGQIEVLFYDLPNGTRPALDFLLSLDKKMRAKTSRTIELLENNGNILGMPYSKHVQDGIFELRTQVGNDITRVMYFFFDGGKAVLTHGFIKKQQKTPPQEIERAKAYRKEYLSRKDK